MSVGDKDGSGELGKGELNVVLNKWDKYKVRIRREACTASCENAGYVWATLAQTQHLGA